MFGSQLGRFLGGNSLAAQLSLGTVIGAIGKEVGSALTMSASFNLTLSVEHAFGTLTGNSNIGSLESGGIAAISSLLMSELADALNLDKFEAGLFQAVSGTITNQLILNAYGMMTGATVDGLAGGPAYTMFTGFDSGAVVLQLESAVAGYFASQFAGEIVVPHHPEGAIGQQIGSAVGGTVGTFILPVVGTFVGTFLGSIAGSIFGDLAGNDPESHGRVVFYTDGRFYPDPTSFTSANGATGATFMNIATYTGNVANALADFAGVTMSAFPVSANPINNTYGLQLIYNQDNHYFSVSDPYHGALATVAYPDSADALSPLVNIGVMALVHSVAVGGGDPLERLAWQNSSADNPTAFSFDLQAAKDYRAYLDDKDMIDTLMAAEPESAFTLGWLITLLKARELGLDAQPASEDFRAGNDNLNGTAAADSLFGGAGGDTIHGGDGDDRLHGGTDRDALFGDNGNDILIGDAGGDWMYGGPGDDTYVRDSLDDWIWEEPGQGTDTVYSSVDYALNPNIENLVLMEGTAAAGGAGNDLANTITGNSNNNWLDGAGGADTMIGGAGDDTYVVDNSGDVTIENPGEGTDTVRSWGSWAVGANIENLILLGSVDSAGYGNELDNTIIGNTGNNLINGGGGNDRLDGGAGADTLIGGPGDDTIIGGDGTDTAVFSGPLSAYTITDLGAGAIGVTGLDGTDTLMQVERLQFDDHVVTVPFILGNDGDNAITGGAGSDTLIGFAGNDILNGLGGADVLIGGTGADTFILTWASVSDSHSGAGFDHIVDYDGSSGAFDAAEGDRIDLSQILQGPYGGGQPLGALVRVVQAGDGALLEVDTDGTANGESWLTIARLEGVRFGDTVTVDLTGAGSGGQSIAVMPQSTGDFSSDHSSDILWRTDGGALAIWDLSGTWIAGADNLRIGATIINADGPNWHILGTGDFDGDGHADILWASDQGYAAVWELDGNQVKLQDTLRSGADPVTRPDPSWHIAGSNDFDGDGKGDVLWRTDSGALAIWELDGTELKSADYIRSGATNLNVPGAGLAYRRHRRLRRRRQGRHPVAHRFGLARAVEHERHAAQVHGLRQQRRGSGARARPRLAYRQARLLRDVTRAPVRKERRARANSGNPW
ncbi:MAG: type I secretion C-terminal target domain-containing protein [Alphaproteobacteria bacterium]